MVFSPAEFMRGSEELLSGTLGTCCWVTQSALLHSSCQPLPPPRPSPGSPQLELPPTLALLRVTLPGLSQKGSGRLGKGPWPGDPRAMSLNPPTPQKDPWEQQPMGGAVYPLRAEGSIQVLLLLPPQLYTAWNFLKQLY